MKKIVFMFCFVTAALCGYRAQSMINPWVDCGNDLGCGAKKAGFNFPIKAENYTVRAMEGMLELRFSLDDGRKVIVRKSVIPEGEGDENGIIDISGDYNVYPVNKTITLDNGVKFSVRGEENSYSVVNFAAETGYYSIICNKGLNKADVEYFYELLSEAEAPKYDDVDD
jgi:hypothetical protein